MEYESDQITADGKLRTLRKKIVSSIASFVICFGFVTLFLVLTARNNVKANYVGHANIFIGNISSKVSAVGEVMDYNDTTTTYLVGCDASYNSLCPFGNGMLITSAPEAIQFTMTPNCLTTQTYACGMLGFHYAACTITQAVTTSEITSKTTSNTTSSTTSKMTATASKITSPITKASSPTTKVAATTMEASTINGNSITQLGNRDITLDGFSIRSLLPPMSITEKTSSNAKTEISSSETTSSVPKKISSDKTTASEKTSLDSKTTFKAKSTLTSDSSSSEKSSSKSITSSTMTLISTSITSNTSSTTVYTTVTSYYSGKSVTSPNGVSNPNQSFYEVFVTLIDEPMYRVGNLQEPACQPANFKLSEAARFGWIYNTAGLLLIVSILVMITTLMAD